MKDCCPTTHIHLYIPQLWVIVGYIRLTSFVGVTSRGEGKTLNSKPKEYQKNLFHIGVPFFCYQLIQEVWLGSIKTSSKIKSSLFVNQQFMSLTKQLCITRSTGGSFIYINIYLGLGKDTVLLSEAPVNFFPSKFILIQQQEYAIYTKLQV